MQTGDGRHRPSYAEFVICQQVLGSVAEQIFCCLLSAQLRHLRCDKHILQPTEKSNLPRVVQHAKINGILWKEILYIRQKTRLGL